MTQFTIRPARKEDCPTILQFVRDLALFEEALDSCLATVKQLESTLGFTDAPQYAHALMGTVTNITAAGEQKEIAVGMAIYFTNYSTWHAAPGIYLEDLYIDPAHRGRGYGTTFLRCLAARVVAIGGKRLEWAVLKSNRPAIDVYTGPHVDAEIMEDWQTCRADGEKLTRMAAMYRQ